MELMKKFQIESDCKISVSVHHWARLWKLWLTVQCTGV